MADNTYPKERKLKYKSEIDLLFQKGKWRTHQNLRLIFLPTAENTGFRIGVSVSKRNFKRAVDRNRIKRLLREIYRLNRPAFEQVFGHDALVMIFYQGKELPKSFADFQQEWQEFLAKLKPAAVSVKPDNISPENAKIPLPDAYSDTPIQPSAEASSPER